MGISTEKLKQEAEIKLCFTSGPEELTSCSLTISTQLSFYLDLFEKFVL